MESDPLFRKACLRLNIPTKIDKPPKTGGARRKQQRIYEVIAVFDGDFAMLKSLARSAAAS